MRFKFLITLSIVFFILSGCKKTVTELVVGENSKDGIATLQEAIEKATQIKVKDKSALVSIILQSGDYHLDKPIKINQQLSGLTISSDGTGEVVVKGSEVLSLDWEQYNENIVVANIDASITFSQFFVNGNAQTLARYPNYDENGGPWQGHAADAIDVNRIAKWNDPTGAIVHTMHSGQWGGFHYYVSGKNDDGTLKFTGGHQNNRPSGMHAKYRMVENIFEELDAAGEWYLASNGKLYFWPPKNLDLTKALFEVPRVKHLIDIEGEANNAVEDVTIAGIRFEQSARTIFDTYEPLLRSDWTIYRGGAVFVENAKNVSIKDCEFTKLGGNVIFVSDFAENVAIEGNHIHDCAASAISFVGHSSAVRSPSFQYGKFVALKDMDTLKGPQNERYPRACKAEGNLIYRIGRLEKQTAGVQISMAKNITVSHNTIYDIPRAGINVSEGTWGGHIIEYNDVFSTVLETSDHGAFNSWGRDRFWHPNRGKMNEITTNNPKMPYWDAIETTIIRNNRFRCDHGWDIDLDDGSSNYHIYNNLCLNGGIKLREGFFRTVENNIMVNNGFHPHVWFKKSGDVFRKNVVMSAHKDIRLQGWGDEVDFNFFSTQKGLQDAQNKGVDKNSIFGKVEFVEPKQYDFRLVSGSPAFNIGFENFPMDQFGVTKPAYKQIAKKPELPKVWVQEMFEKGNVQSWLGAGIKSIETLEERSAYGLKNTAGIVVLSKKDKSLADLSGLKAGDVIIKCGEIPVNEVRDLLEAFNTQKWKGKLDLTVVRNQSEMKITLLTKK